MTHLSPLIFALYSKRLEAVSGGSQRVSRSHGPGRRCGSVGLAMAGQYIQSRLADGKFVIARNTVSHQSYWSR